MKVVLVAVYLGAIVAANLSVAEWGPRAAAYNAFLFIGLDLVARDRLHDAWGGQGRTLLWLRLGVLIGTGSILSYLVSKWLDVGPPGLIEKVALASGLAFLVAATLDAVVYQACHRLPWLERSNRSNVVGAAADSVVFQSVAFGWSFPLVFAQFVAKVAGGLVWSLVLARRRS